MCRSRFAGTVARDLVQAAIGLGSNLGDRLGHLRQGLEGLRRAATLAGVSSLYESAPVGGPHQDRYLNAVALIETTFSPRHLLAALHEIEAGAARVRQERWGPRTLDLDLLVYDECVVDDPDLEVPHPRAHERQFVLLPLVEVWPEAALRSGPAREALEHVSPQGITLLAEQWWDIDPGTFDRDMP